MKNNIAAIYCRLSKEDLDKDFGKPLSESIKNQKSMLEAFASERQWDIYDFYIDEDYSGSDRDRPAFNRLITDSLLGRFNIVLCKKQARFARDIEYVEKYIHGLFAERQIRFVAVLDNIDTGAISRSVRKASQINSLVDEWYLSDLSENIVASLTTKRKNAEFIGSWAPYGYRKDPNHKNSLLVDRPAAEIVKKIFLCYCNGSGVSKIARDLNAAQIPNPLLYKRLQGEKINPNPEKLTDKRYLWTPSTVSAVLHNQTYNGSLVQGKFKKASYKSKKLLRIPPTDWIVIPGCHEPIIDPEIWTDVQKILASKCRVSAGSPSRHLLAGKVFCGECGSRLVASGGRSGSRNTSYLCCSKHKFSKEACPGARIEASCLERLLLDRILAFQAEFFDETYLSESTDFNLKRPESKTLLQIRLRALQDRAGAIERKKDMLYADKLDRIITSDQYITFRDRLDQEVEAVEAQLHQINAEIGHMGGPMPEPESASQPDTVGDILSGYKTFPALTQDLTDQLIESVYVSKRQKGRPQEITINWNF